MGYLATSVMTSRSVTRANRGKLPKFRRSQMSVLMTLRAPADVSKFEKLAAEDPAIFQGIIARAKERGLISHRFWASDTEVFVVDEWPNEESFNGFFQTTPEIQELMRRAGVTGPPQVSFWRSADTRDEYPPVKDWSR